MGRRGLSRLTRPAWAGPQRRRRILGQGTYENCQLGVPIDVYLRVLVVDDSEIVTAAVTRVLQRAGFEVTVAHSCAEARQCAWLGPFLVSIVDLDLPDGSGVELAEWMRREGYVGTTAFHTGDASGTDMAERARRLGPVIPKGVPPRDLVAIVANAAQLELREASEKVERILQRPSLRPLRTARREVSCSSRASARVRRRERRRNDKIP